MLLEKMVRNMKKSYDKLILSTGSLPIDLPIIGKDLENVQYVKIIPKCTRSY